MNKKGFTLAEVLITLGIIGVVSAITIPSVVNKVQEQRRINKLKKTYSILSQAYQRILSEEGNYEYWLDVTKTKQQQAEIIAGKFKPYLKIMKDCAFQTGCLKDDYVKSLSGVNYQNYNRNENEYKLILSDGVSLMFYSQPILNTGFVGNIKIAIDGIQNTHVWGKDFFLIFIFKNKLRPEGVAVDNRFVTYCINKDAGSNYGLGCAAWVIYNGNMDYLHCPEKLNWNGKTKCD